MDYSEQAILEHKKHKGKLETKSKMMIRSLKKEDISLMKRIKRLQKKTNG